MDTEQLRRAMQDRVVKIVADATGINYYTLLRFTNGQRTSRPETLDKLRKYLEGKE